MTKTIEIPIEGMDCAECALHVQKAITSVPYVLSADVLLGAEKALIQVEAPPNDLVLIHAAVADAGYSVPAPQQEEHSLAGTDFTSKVMRLFGLVFGAVLFIVVVGEWMGLFESITTNIPWYLGLGVVLLIGYPVFLKVIRSVFRGKIIAHTLTTMGLLAAVAVGEWSTAAVVVFFMRIGEYAETFTAERARRALKELSGLTPQTARVWREGKEIDLPVEKVQINEIVIVRPGEHIPVDGEVVDGQATIDQATITGESMPVEAGIGSKVFAATLAQLGSLRIRTTHIGRDTTFGRVIQMVEEAEAHRADIQGIADKFASWYLPVVAVIAGLTFIITRDPLATTAVLVVACACSFALATPMAMMASIGAGAKRGLLIKGSKYLETLARANVLLIDKTGTLTLGQPLISSQWSLNNNWTEDELLRLTASAERYSEHPLAEAVRSAARDRGLSLSEPKEFNPLPGMGLRARIDNHTLAIGSRRMIAPNADIPQADALEAQGKTLLFVRIDNELAGFLAAEDSLRPEIPAALSQLRSQGITQIELLTGDNARTAGALAEKLSVAYQAEMLPEDKISVVKRYQSEGKVVVMVGDGVNDAPALAQADVGIAMGVAGTDVALEAAHIALMREDWMLVPNIFQIARKTMRVIKFNLGFTAVYNVIGLTLAAFGILPPILAAAAQSMPDLGILANSARLLKQD
ncbi:MAG: cadmium-translocating P-type ATPase [Chloroflexota bacterium]|nr:MAG: cadmium-translocating P-type ATPase [Chloroflexota bacterium]HDD62759.1 cadmium-translocating P-type ATPase [Chloroflexota bacterium]